MICIYFMYVLHNFPYKLSFFLHPKRLSIAKKTAYALNTPRIVSLQSYSSVASLSSALIISRFVHYWQPRKTFFDLVTLTFDLWPWLRYPFTGPACKNSGRLGRRVISHTHTHTMSRLLHPSLTQGVITGLHFQKVYTHSGTSCPQCVYQIWWCIYSFCQILLLSAHAYMHLYCNYTSMHIPGIRIECLIAILRQNTYMHEQITKGFGIMNTCISRFGIRIGDRKYAFWKCKPVNRLSGHAYNSYHLEQLSFNLPL